MCVAVRDALSSLYSHLFAAAFFAAAGKMAEDVEFFPWILELRGNGFPTNGIPHSFS